MPYATTDDGAGLWESVASNGHDLLSSIIPAPLFTILAGFSNLAYRLVLGVSNDPSSWTSTLLPPLIALAFAYISLVLAYRTVRNTILVVWWGIKWGAIIGAGIALWAWWVGEGDAITSQGQVPASSWLSSVAAGPGLMTALYSLAQNFNQDSSSSSRRRSGQQRDRRSRSTRSASSAASDPMEAIYAAARAAAGGFDTTSSTSSTGSSRGRRGRSESFASSEAAAAPPLEDLLNTLGVSPSLISTLLSAGGGAGELLSPERLQEWFNTARQSGNSWLGQTWDDLLAGGQGQARGVDGSSGDGTSFGPAYNTRSRGQRGQRAEQHPYNRSDRNSRVRRRQQDDQFSPFLSSVGRAGQAFMERMRQ